jgi:hypothetical protein
MSWQESVSAGLTASRSGDAGARAYRPQIAPKWIAPDGKSFWLAWTDFQEGADGTGARRAPGPAADGASDEEIRRRLPGPWPCYAFNVQRVDLAVA